MGIRSHRDPAEWKGELTKQIEVMQEQISVYRELYTGDKIVWERAESPSDESVSTTDFSPSSPENQTTPKKGSSSNTLLVSFKQNQKSLTNNRLTKKTSQTREIKALNKLSSYLADTHSSQ